MLRTRYDKHFPERLASPFGVWRSALAVQRSA
jgi:hypothetical protein